MHLCLIYVLMGVMLFLRFPCLATELDFINTETSLFWKHSQGPKKGFSRNYFDHLEILKSGQD